MESISGQTAGAMTVSGIKTKCMEKEHTTMRMVEPTLVNLSMIRKTERAFWCFLMAKSTTAVGKTTNKRATECLPTSPDRPGMAGG